MSRIAVAISILCFCSFVHAADAVLVRTDALPQAHNFSGIDPILDSTGNLAGFIYADSADSQFVLHRFQDGTLSVIPLDGTPAGSLNYLSGDSLILYLLWDTFFSQKLDRYTLTDSIRLDTSRFVQYTYRWIGQINSQKIKFVRDEKASPTGLTFETSIFYQDNYPTIGTVYEDLGLASRLDLTLRQRTFLGNLMKVEPGNYTPVDGLEFAGYQDYRYDLWDPDGQFDSHHRYTVICDVWPDTTKFAKINIDYSWTHAFYGGDFIPSNPYDEIIYYGFGADLTGAHPTPTDHIACYSIDDTTYHQLWYQPLSGVTLYRPFLPGQVIAGMRDDSTVIFISSRNGQQSDQIVLGRPLQTPTFFETESSGLFLAGHSGDSIFVYRFDNIVDVNEDTPPNVPTGFALAQNFPNPFNPSTTISFSLPRAADITLDIFNLLGQHVRTLATARFSAGTHSVTWDGTDSDGSPCASGLYLYRLSSPSFSQSRKMLLLK